MTRYLPLAALALATVLATVARAQQPVTKDAPAVAAARSIGTTPTAAAARLFVDSVERRLDALSVTVNQAEWVAATYITDDTEALSADAQQRYDAAAQRFALAARRFDGVTVPPDLRRKLTLLKLAFTAPPPSDPAKGAELVRLTTGMEGAYGRGTYCRRGALGQPAATTGDSTCYQINDLSRALAESHDPAVLLDAWRGWHAIGAPLRPKYERFVALSNEGARELGFADLGAMWRANYDMPADQFPREVERLWKQVEPLYVALHAYVRTRLNQQYGDAVVAKDGMIPAHLLGNMWAQEWGNVYPIVAPPNASPTYDLTALLKAKNVDAKGMAKYAEGFFTSMGFAPLPATFWERSMLVKPRDREVVCHASAWTIDNKNDVRIKACLEPTADDFVTIHHEEGHNFYQRAYSSQPYLFQNGANDGFHEAIGDAIALSITPGYLQQAGLLATPPSAAADTALLLRQALDKVAFLPFGLMIDQWRWGVFSGAIKPSEYNKAWWDLRARYQGVVPPVARSEADFDPGAKYHVPANTPYMRYFLARVLQFQFYRAMCRAAGHTGPLYRCSFYGSKEAGAKLARMLEAGQSKPWQETLYEMTGERDMDAGAMLEYFAPLKAWLDRQNAGHPVGWTPRTATR
ncbi:peptidase M2 peptidyl-dipeptidase A [Gemmatirosa kalamazoonensis]|uniref:Peptidase M2 peptidyl-dipeptidase A n=1 Tax=Gemmatirosa kalamazoonensis TaxID=861299 RepID=W0R935_9BACT|nr:M2 family metallopeptidase [Gemmatirosa kalamazoonensis]AHG87629.1 peptidase M2 peptidyl-dipeptidase A [Gemmatirosa kalamazoonensis]